MIQYKVIRWIFVINALYVFLLLVRQIFQIDTITTMLIFSQLALIVLIISGLNTLKLKSEELLLISLVLLALFKSEFETYRITDILVGFAKPILFILAIASIRSKKNIEILTDRRFERIFILYVLTTVFSVCVGMYYYSFMGSIYPAYSSVYSLLGYFYLVGRSRFSSIGFLLVLALSGKRAVLLSGILAQIRTRSILKKIASWLPVALIASISGIIFLYQIGLDWIAQNVLKINLEMVSEAVDNVELLRYITGGRMDELIDGLSYDFTPFNILFGKSLGYTYDSLAFENANHKNFHFTPASLFTEYGLLFTVLFALYIFRIIFNDAARSTAMIYTNVYAIRMYLIGSLFFFLTEYGVFGYINFCIGLGLLAGVKSFTRQAINTMPAQRLTGN